MSARAELPAEIRALWARLDGAQRDQFLAFAVRIRNGDAKAYRLAELHLAGAISFVELLRSCKPAQRFPRPSLT